MPSRLYFSNSLDALAERLIQGLGGNDPFNPPDIATPSSALRGWLQIRMAEKLGIAANLKFPHLEKLLWNRLAELDHFRNAEDRQPARLLDTLNFQGMILTWLSSQGGPAALKHYLKPEDGEPYDEARRLCQLSGRLASLFREYEYSRVSEGGFKGLAETWSRGENCFDQYHRGPKFSSSQRNQVRKLEEWQREIYQALFREGGLRDRWGEASGVYRYTLPQYAEMVLNQTRTPQAPLRGVGGESVPTFHLFGLSHISPFHRALIYRLGDEKLLGNKTADFEIYALNPCAESWEDTTISKRRLSDAELQEEELPFESEENALLSRLGKPGRETIKLWSQITDYDFESCFKEPESNTLLNTVQGAVLHRQGPLIAEERKAQDASLQIFSAPDRYAEVESAKARIAELLLTDKDLRLEDIAIIPANFEEYLPVIETVFSALPPNPPMGGSGGKGAGYVPYCLPEAGMLSESALLRGFRDLMALGAGTFRRHELVKWIENSTVSKRLRLNRGTIIAFGNFLERSGFQEGWDDEYPDQDSIPGSLSTAEAAIQRALLGLILDPTDANLETAGFHPAANAVAGWDREELSRCLELLENLRNDLRPFRSGEILSFKEWSEWLLRLLENYFAVDSEQPLEIQAAADLRRFCADLAHWESVQGISHHAISVLLEDHFRDPRSVRMPFLQGGVRIGSLNALRSLPFKHVYILGLNAGDFPASREASPLDLRGYRRVLGEADPATRDLYAFLESISTTSECLMLSYVRRDAARDSVRQPSQALAGLIAYLESDIFPHGTSFQIVELDSDGRSTDSSSPRPRVETLRMKAITHHSNLSEADARTLVASHYPSSTPVKWAELPEVETPVWDLRHLTMFLQNPAEHACFQHFRLNASRDDGEQSQPLFLNKWETGKLLQTGLRVEFVQPGQGKDAVLLALQRQIWNGQGPPGLYADLEMETLRVEAENFLENKIADLRDAIQSLGLHYAGTLRLGGQGMQLLEPPILDYPAFNASTMGIPALIQGTVPLFFKGKGSEGGWGLCIDEKAHDREILFAYLFHLCVAALDSEKNFSGPGYILSPDTEKIFLLPKLDPKTAARDLKSILDDAGHVPDFDHLPLQTIEKIVGKDFDNLPNNEDWKELIEEKEREDEESAFAPLNPPMGGRGGKRSRILRGIEPEVPTEAGVKIRRRILPYLQWKNGWDEVGDDES